MGGSSHLHPESNYKHHRPEGTAVKRRWQGHYHVEDRHGGQEEDEQQHAQVEIIGSGGFEDPGLRNVAAHHGPALEVHGCVESKNIDAREARCKEGAHPGKKTECAQCWVSRPEGRHRAGVVLLARGRRCTHTVTAETPVMIKPSYSACVCYAACRSLLAAGKVHRGLSQNTGKLATSVITNKYKLQE